MTTNLSHFTLVNQVNVEPEYTVVLVGTAIDGPSNTPFTLNIDMDPYVALGDSPLADAYNAARQVGMESIVAYRLNGTHAEAVLKDKNGKAVIKFRSVSASDIYNNIQMIVFPDHLFITSTQGESRSYFFDKYPKVTDLVYGINRDSYYGLLEFNAIELDEYYSLSNMVDAVTEVMFEGGSTEESLINHRDPSSDETTDPTVIVPLLKQRLESALFGDDPEDIEKRLPNNHLGILNYGVITLCDMYHDDDPELTELLGSFCLNKTKETDFGCIAVIGTKPIYPEVVDEGETIDFNETVRTRVLELVSLSESIEETEAYKYIQVVVGDSIYPESNGRYVSLAHAYAATQAQMPYYTMMTNKAIRGFGKLNYDISKEDIALLSSNGYTCIVPSIRRGFVPYYATSFSKDKDSTLQRPHNVRISQYVSRMLVDELDSLVGSNLVKLSIEDAIERAEEILVSLVTSKVVKDYDLDYELLDYNTVLNLSVSLTPFSEIKAVTSVATISFPQGVIA